MSQIAIETILRDKIGLAASTIGAKEIARAVEKRRLACNLPDWQTYLQKLQTSSEELDELIESVIVPETWFFRDGEPFKFLKSYVTTEWLPNQKLRSLRILSIPCSTGEEPYSIAMTLLDGGLTLHQFQIDAVDISKKSLQKAKQGIYSQNSFRGNNLEFRQRYFTQMGDEYKLNETVKNAVNLRWGNLQDANLLSEQKLYDIIFCRNALIYFDSTARERSIKNINRLLAKEGLLFLGHAETGQIMEYGFVSVRHPFAFAYRKKEVKNPENESESVKYLSQIDGKLNNQKNHAKIWEKLPTVKPVTSLTREKSPGTMPITPASKETKENSIPMLIPNLETARNLANNGNLNEAAALCETYLKQNCTSVDAYLLLGQIYQAKGLEEQAEQCFQKAVYLEPNHYDALLHLTLLKEQRGDLTKAAVLRQRIERLRNL